MTTSQELVRLNATLTGQATIKANLTTPTKIISSNYDDLTNKPAINGVELSGDKSFEDLGEYDLTNLEIKKTFDKVFGG